MDINDLYQELIIDHGTEPRNFYKLDNPTHTAHGFNPLCGDEINLDLKINNNIIEQASFVGHGCAISTASASIMTELLKDQTIQQAQSLFNNFQQTVTNTNYNNLTNTITLNLDLDLDLGKLTALAGVRVFPSRVKCATLPWHTLLAALQKNSKIATTEY